MGVVLGVMLWPALAHCQIQVPPQRAQPRKQRTQKQGVAMQQMLQRRRFPTFLLCTELVVTVRLLAQQRKNAIQVHWLVDHFMHLILRRQARLGSKQEKMILWMLPRAPLQQIACPNTSHIWCVPVLTTSTQC